MLKNVEESLVLPMKKQEADDEHHTCVSTCASGAGTHRRRFGRTDTTHHTPHRIPRHNTTQHDTPQQHVETERDRERQREKTEKEREEKTKEDERKDERENEGEDETRQGLTDWIGSSTIVL